MNAEESHKYSTVIADEETASDKKQSPECLMGVQLLQDHQIYLQPLDMRENLQQFHTEELSDRANLQLHANYRVALAKSQLRVRSFRHFIDTAGSRI